MDLKHLKEIKITEMQIRDAQLTVSVLFGDPSPKVKFSTISELFNSSTVIDIADMPHFIATVQNALVAARSMYQDQGSLKEDTEGS